jgi:hypothetical protein
VTRSLRRGDASADTIGKLPCREVSGVAGTVPHSIVAADEPVVMRGLVADWPSVRAAGDGNPTMLAYLRERCADKAILAFQGDASQRGRYFYNAELSGFNFERIQSKLVALLDLLAGQERGEACPYLYVGSTSLREYLPGFLEQNPLQIEGAKPVASIWLGNRSRIAAHFDAPANVACCVAGRRRFTLFPPEQLPNLYVGPLDFTPAGQAISLVDFAAPDFQCYPRFRDALAAARVVELNPGDALYLPSMWWHHVEGLESFNVLVNYWWTAAGQVLGNPLNVLIHALLSLRGLSAAQRRAWQGMLEHYVFAPDPEGLAHIPPERLGVLGEMDEASLRQLRDMLRNRLDPGK